MITCIIPENGGGLSPALILIIQDLHQVLKVYPHDIGVRIGLEKAEILLPMAIHGGYQSNPRPYTLERQRVADTFHLPLPPAEI